MAIWTTKRIHLFLTIWLLKLFLAITQQIGNEGQFCSHLDKSFKIYANFSVNILLNLCTFYRFGHLISVEIVLS